MATYDMTAKATATVGANSTAAAASGFHANPCQMIEAYLDFGKLVASGSYTLATGDVFQVLEIPAGTLVLTAGAEVMTAFDGTCTVDVDFAAGDDIIDGADVTSVGFCAEGTNGMANSIILADQATVNPTYDGWVTATDTIDVLVASADATVGVLRVYALVVDFNENASVPAEAARDALA